MLLPRLMVVVASASLYACATMGGPNPQTVSSQLRERTGATARPFPFDTTVPPGVTVDDGLTENEAVAVGLWNNVDFQVSISELGFVRADLLEAGLLHNPVLSLLLPVGPKQLEATLKWPVEVLWERPRRVSAARLASQSTAQRLVQVGLDLVARLKTAYADAALAEDRRRFADEAATLFQRIDELTQSRLAAGDVSELEARASRVDAARAQQDSARAVREVDVARNRLREILGFAVTGQSFDLTVDGTHRWAWRGGDANEPP